MRLCKAVRATREVAWQMEGLGWERAMRATVPSGCCPQLLPFVLLLPLRIVVSDKAVAPGLHPLCKGLLCSRFRTRHGGQKHHPPGERCGEGIGN